MAKFGSSLGLAFAIASAAAPVFAESGIEVTMNQAKIVKLRARLTRSLSATRDIADASVQDASTVVLTGKGFGVTNLVVLDEAGAPIIDEQISVSRSTAETVRIYRRATVQTLPAHPIAKAPTRAKPSACPKRT